MEDTKRPESIVGGTQRTQTAQSSDDDDDVRRELREYVAGLRAHADTTCEQLQAEVKKQRTIALVRGADSQKGPRNDFWKEWAEHDDQDWKARALRAEKDVASMEKRAVEAEFRAASLEASSPADPSNPAVQRELKLDDLLPMLRRLGVKIILGSVDDELDSLMKEVLEPSHQSKAQAPNILQDKNSCKNNCALGDPEGVLPFTQFLHRIREEMEQAFQKLALQYAQEMPRNTSDLRHPRSHCATASLAVVAPPMADKPFADSAGATTGLRDTAVADAPAPVFVLPGQVADVLESVESLERPNVQSKAALSSIPNQGKAAWEPILCPVWESLPRNVEHEDSLEMGLPQCRFCCCSTSSESSRIRFVWDVLSAFVVAYDVGVTPLHMLGLPNNIVFNTMLWAKPVFWLLDILWSFTSGFVHDGIDELHLHKIAWRYMKTWLLSDCLFLALDVCTLLMLTHGTFTLLTYKDRRLHGWHGLTPTLRQEKILYSLRCLLAGRLLKVHGKMGRRFGWRIQSQPLRIKLGVAHLAWLILLCCHIAACGFYAIGTLYDGQDNSWVEKNLEGKTLGIKYVLCLQWSLAQFTHGTTDVHAGSFAEASYSAGVTLIAAFLLLLLFAKVVGAILQLASTPEGKRMKEMSALMEYLLQCQAPAPLRSRVWATAAERSAHAKTAGRRIHEGDVPILACLPHVLQDELRAMAYRPVLLNHPLFRELELGPGASSCEGGRAANKLHGGLSEVGLRAGQLLFSAEAVAVSMYFVVQGNLRYCVTSAEAVSAKEVQVGPWFSEPALWIHWAHRGDMTAVTYSELFALDAQRFQEIMKQELPEAAFCWRYSARFVNYAKQCQMNLTDIDIDHAALDGMLSHALVPDGDPAPMDV